MKFGISNGRKSDNLVDDYEEVLEALQEVLDTVEEVRNSGREGDFLDSVEAQACDMKTWIEEREVATKAQERTAANWLEAAKKWLPDF